MPTLVRTKDTFETYIYLGTGYGKSQSQSDGFARTKSEIVRAICACDENGNIVWLHAHNIVVVTVDGKNPKDWL